MVQYHSQINKDDSQFDFIYDDFFFIPRQKKFRLHQTSYEIFRRNNLLSCFQSFLNHEFQSREHDGKKKKNINNTKNPNKQKKHGSKNCGTKHVGKTFYLCKVKHKTIISVTVPCNEILTASFLQYWHYSTATPIALTIYIETLRQSRTVNNLYSYINDACFDIIFKIMII